MGTIPDRPGATRCDGSVPFGPKWVLVVADDAADRMMLFRFLERAGHHATVSDDVDAALELLRAEPYDLVLLDLSRLKPDGHAIVRHMKTDRRLRNIPVLVIAGCDQSEAVSRCLRLGAQDYIFKPCEPLVLRDRVATGLQGRRRLEPATARPA